MTVNPQAQTLLMLQLGRKRLAPPRLRNWELSNCGLYSKLRATRAISSRPTSGMSRIFRTRTPPEAFPCAITGLRGNESAKLPMLYFHGGGWMVGDIETHDVIAGCSPIEAGSLLLMWIIVWRPKINFRQLLKIRAVTQWVINGAVDCP